MTPLAANLPAEDSVLADPTPLQPGRLQLRCTSSEPRVRYYCWAHPEPRPGAPWLVAVHGISRTPREQILRLRRSAAAAGLSLLAPHFDAVRFPRYQRLGLRGEGPRADLALLGILDDLRALGGGPQVDLFGFSGGAQFAHRFALVHPRRVRRLSVAAAGWYTLPDPRRVYPYGMAPGKRKGDLPFRCGEFLRIRKLVLVGSEDRARDDALRTGRRLDREQGRNRLERAICWARRVDAAAEALGIDVPPVTLQVLPRTGHSFEEAVLSGGLDHRLVQFLIA